MKKHWFLWRWTLNKQSVYVKVGNPPTFCNDYGPIRSSCFLLFLVSCFFVFLFIFLDHRHFSESFVACTPFHSIYLSVRLSVEDWTRNGSSADVELKEFDTCVHAVRWWIASLPLCCFTMLLYSILRSWNNNISENIWVGLGGCALVGVVFGNFHYVFIAELSCVLLCFAPGEQRRGACDVQDGIEKCLQGCFVLCEADWEAERDGRWWVCCLKADDDDAQVVCCT